MLPEGHKRRWFSHHSSNWVDADEDDSDEDEENDLCIQATPPYYEEQ